MLVTQDPSATDDDPHSRSATERDVVDVDCYEHRLQDRQVVPAARGEIKDVDFGTAVWEGGIRDGKGAVSTKSGAFGKYPNGTPAAIMESLTREIDAGY